MGNAASGPTASALQFLSHISGPHAVDLSDPAWTALFTLSKPLAQIDPATVQAELRPHTASLGVFTCVGAHGGWRSLGSGAQLFS